ncbi:efflux RND transporter periplasmic adaptor subunit, partial [Clostridioides difficile]|nr:efflux RND transporter periplasmic adaptor subunit [Clostridioides difficile]
CGISDLSTVWAEMAVPAQRLNDVRVGRDATVIATAFESRSSGPIAYGGALLGEQTRTAPARVVLPLKDLKETNRQMAAGELKARQAKREMTEA